jgi:NADP-dependent 3-hydroxy acid dehydrogenase YdfG
MHVVAVGRRREMLSELVEKHGKDKVSMFEFDITKLSEIPSFVEKCASYALKIQCVN